MGFSALSITKACYFFESARYVRGSDMNARRLYSRCFSVQHLISI